MRIEDGTVLNNVNVWLSAAEVAELRDALEDMLRMGATEEWHAHVSSADFETEISVAWESSPAG